MMHEILDQSSQAEIQQEQALGLRKWQDGSPGAGSQSERNGLPAASPALVEIREDNWADLGDSEALRYDLVKNRVIGSDLCISLSKMGVDCLKIEIRNSKFMQQDLQSSFEDSLTLKSSQALRPLVECPSTEHVNLVKFIVNASQRNKFVCKLLKVRDHSVNRILLLTCDLKDHQITVRVIELLTH